MPLHIGVDLDGCPFNYVNNIVGFIVDEAIAEGNLDFADRVKNTPVSHWHWYRDWGWTDEQFVAANERAAAASVLYRGPIEPGWIEVLTQLREDGHSIHIITARFEGSPGPTSDWLLGHKVPHDALTFAKDKSKLGLDVLIDDRHENIRDWVATGKWGILYSQPWNEHSNTGAMRAFSPEHVRGAISYIVQEEAARERAANNTVTETILQEAQRLVHGDRGDDYGHPVHDFSRTGRIWGAVLGLPGPVSPQDVALCMIGVKMSREVHKPKRDNRTDIAGYAETLDMVAEYQGTHATELTP